MRFVVDECTGPSIARWLESIGHDAVSIYDDAPSLADVDILAFAVSSDRVIITNNKVFGDLVFRERQPHRGIVFLRLADNTVAAKRTGMERFPLQAPEEMSRCFVVVTDRTIRVSQSDG